MGRCAGRRRLDRFTRDDHVIVPRRGPATPGRGGRAALRHRRERLTARAWRISRSRSVTRFVSWRWEKPAPPERRIAAIFSYQYIVEGWDSYDVTS